ncbi:hypothetical protein GCK32_021740, partial [Trichostrongylus colubriformis]
CDRFHRIVTLLAVSRTFYYFCHRSAIDRLMQELLLPPDSSTDKSP